MAIKRKCVDKPKYLGETSCYPSHEHWIWQHIISEEVAKAYLAPFTEDVTKLFPISWWLASKDFIVIVGAEESNIGKPIAVYHHDSSWWILVGR